MGKSLLQRIALAYGRGGTSLLKSRAFEYSEIHGSGLPILGQVAAWRTVKRLRKHQQSEECLDDIIRTVGTFDKPPEFHGTWPFYNFVAKQNFSELKEITLEVEELSPNCIVEVGSARGGSLYVWARHFNANTVVSVDLDHRGRESVFRQFDPETDIIPIEGNSHEENTISEVSEAIGEQAPDFVYIDASHEYEDVKADFDAYQGIVSEDGAIGFHDVDGSWRGVTKFWEEIQSKYDTKRVGENNGNGIIYL